MCLKSWHSCGRCLGERTPPFTEASLSAHLERLSAPRRRAGAWRTAFWPLSTGGWRTGLFGKTTWRAGARPSLGVTRRCPLACSPPPRSAWRLLRPPLLPPGTAHDLPEGNRKPPPPRPASRGACGAGGARNPYLQGNLFLRRRRPLRQGAPASPPPTAARDSGPGSASRCSYTGPGANRRWGGQNIVPPPQRPPAPLEPRAGGRARSLQGHCRTLHGEWGGGGLHGYLRGIPSPADGAAAAPPPLQNLPRGQAPSPPRCGRGGGGVPVEGGLRGSHVHGGPRGADGRGGSRGGCCCCGHGAGVWLAGWLAPPSAPGRRASPRPGAARGSGPSGERHGEEEEEEEERAEPPQSRRSAAPPAKPRRSGPASAAPGRPPTAAASPAAALAGGASPPGTPGRRLPLLLPLLPLPVAPGPPCASLPVPPCGAYAQPRSPAFPAAAAPLPARPPGCAAALGKEEEEAGMEGAGGGLCLPGWRFSCARPAPNPLPSRLPPAASRWAWGAGRQWEGGRSCAPSSSLSPPLPAPGANAGTVGGGL